ncbi:hypothetical protein WJX84_000005, partial [Apatococcus fuscideae]
ASPEGVPSGDPAGNSTVVRQKEPEREE